MNEKREKQSLSDVSKQTIDYYNGIASGYNNLYGSEQINKLNLISSRIKPKSNETLLDIGCGTGISADFFDCKLFGIEPSQKMLNIAKEKYEDEKYEWTLGGGEDILENYKGKEFDFIICVSSIHHIENIFKLFKDIKELSKENTKYCFSLLKNSSRNEEILNEIELNFKIIEKFISEKDTIVLFMN